MPNIDRPRCALFDDRRWRRATNTRVNYGDYLGLARRDLKERIVKGWLSKAVSLPNENSLEAFFYVWVSFNAWGQVVVRTEGDRAMVDALAVERGLDAAFTLSVEEPTYRQQVADFWALWPIRDPRHSDCLEPRCWDSHDPQATRYDWAHTLQAIYRARNNLFHGGKLPVGRRDAEIVSSAATVLAGFLLRTGWPDRDFDRG